MRYFKKITYLIVAISLLMNVVAAFHAYKFTHFSNEQGQLTPSPQKLTGLEKVKALLFGVSNYKPQNNVLPNSPYSTITIETNEGALKIWQTKVDSSKGVVIVLHGYHGQKSSMIDRAAYFNTIGFSTLLVDFRGCGDSFGLQSTIGFDESKDVKAVFNYANNHFINIYIFGSSMGSVAAMKCIHDFNIKPQGLLIECPFGSMYQTTSARFQNMGLPSFPMATLLVFWGGVINGFWGFHHNPTYYAKSINCPTLLLYGLEDDKVSLQETITIFNNINGRKRLSLFKETGHDNYLKSKPIQWKEDISKFLFTKS